MAVVLCVYVFASVGTYAIALDSAAPPLIIVERKSSSRSSSDLPLI
jgi:hypothetical protein